MQKNKLQLDEIKLTDLQRIEPMIRKDIYEILNIENSVNSRNSYGGTAPEEVKKAIKRAKRNIFNENIINYKHNINFNIRMW